MHFFMTVVEFPRGKDGYVRPLFFHHATFIRVAFVVEWCSEANSRLVRGAGVRGERCGIASLIKNAQRGMKLALT